MAALKEIELGEARKLYFDDKEFYIKTEADEYIYKLQRVLWLALARAAETGRRFWAKEQVFAIREGRKKDSEKAWKMEKRRERQVKLFKAKADKFKE